MARDQGYLVSYIAKLAQYCDVLLLKGAYRIGIDEIVKNVNNGKINYVNLASPLVKADIKEDPDNFIKRLDANKINVLNNIQYLPEIIQYLQSLYSNLKKSNKTNTMKIIIGTCAEIHAFENLHQILAEKMFTTNLFPVSAAEASEYNNNILDKLYAKELHQGVFDKNKITEVMRKATFVNYTDEYSNDYFDDFLNSILNQNVSSLYNLNSPSKSVKIMTELANSIGRITQHLRICHKIALDDITYPNYYQAILDSFIGFELPPIPHSWLSDSNENDDEDNSLETKFYFIDSNFLAYLKGTTITRHTLGDFFTFNHIYQNFVISELKKITSANAGINLWYLQRNDCKMDAIITREDQSAIAIKIRGNDQVTNNDIHEFNNLKNLLGERFHRGYVIYLGTELKQIDDQVYALPVNYLWSDPLTN